MGTATRPNPTLGRHGWLVLVAVIVLTIGIGQASFGHSMLQRVGLYKQPSGFTSLAFVNPQSLPERLKMNRTAIGISFVISNRENTTRDYQWALSSVQAGHTQRIADGVISIKSGRSAIITRPAKIFCTQRQVKIVVSLESPAEHIDALAACP
jgi:hypothetical protein